MTRFRFWQIPTRVMDYDECEQLLERFMRKSKEQPAEVIESRFIPIILAIDGEWQTLREIRKHIPNMVLGLEDVKTTLAKLVDAEFILMRVSPRWNGAKPRMEYKRREW